MMGERPSSLNFWLDTSRGFSAASCRGLVTNCNGVPVVSETSCARSRTRAVCAIWLSISTGDPDLGGVVDGELNALARVRDVDQRARLAARAVDGKGDAQRALHQEAV
eukprot:CAMPEP_0179867236 /NCGR_PEP_ID=MMETSP0982-20121206/18028_1 /TAXON_ID=483367 /ORGANISM="non described non described, Strain CCMP 2436" /LENGTH=107 /DNA_ID=CAMNT_0021756513 /DNA_START=490 /DNA_END=812 /DNA_ORIENTATION=+